MANSKVNDSIPNRTERILFHLRFHSTNFAQPSLFLGFSKLKDFVFNISFDFISTERNGVNGLESVLLELSSK